MEIRMTNFLFAFFKSQGLHGRQGRQGLGLGWILRTSKRQGQRQHAGEVAATMAALSVKNLPWRP